MMLRVWLLVFALVARAVAAEPETIPQSVAEYRTRIAQPSALAEEIIMVVREKISAQKAFLDARQEVAFCAMRTLDDIDAALEAASASAQTRADAAVEKRNPADTAADATARREEALALAELADLRLAAGALKDSLAAQRRRVEALAAVAEPEEWLQASLDLVGALMRAEEREAALALFSLAKKMTTPGGPLENSPAPAARVLACEAWLGPRDETTSPEDYLATGRLAADALEKSLGRKHPQTRATLVDLVVRLSVSPTNREDALKFLPQLIAAQEAALGPEHPATIRAVVRLGNLLWNVKDPRGPYAELQRALAAWSNGAGWARTDRLAVAYKVATRERQKGEYETAEKIFRQLIDAGIKANGAEHRTTLWYRNDLAMVLSARGDYTGAEKLARDVNEIRQRVLGPKDSDSLLSLNNLAVHARSLGRYREAEAMFQKVLALRLENGGAANAETLRVKANLASSLLALGDLAPAEKLAREALDKRQSTLGADNTDTLASRSDVARVLLAKGDLAEAEQIARSAMDGRVELNGEDHPFTLAAASTLGRVLSAKGEHPKALELFYRTLGLSENRYGADDPGTNGIRRGHGEALLEAGDLDGADAALRKVLAYDERTLGREHPETIEVTGILGRLLLKKGDRPAAEPLLRKTLEQAEAIYDKEHPLVADMANALAELLDQAGKPEEALPLAERAAAIGKSKLPGNQRIRGRYDALVEKLRKNPK